MANSVTEIIVGLGTAYLLFDSVLWNEGIVTPSISAHLTDVMGGIAV